MVLRRAVGVALAAIALIGVTRELEAQPFTVTNNGQPMAGAQVSAMINGIKNPLGTTNSVGEVTIDMNALNITKGTEVTVWIKTCEDGTVQVIMVPAGEEGECANEGQQAGEDCGCRRAGVIVWGDGPVTIDIGTGTATQVRTGTGGGWANRWTAGVGFDILQMLELDNVIEETGGTNIDATSWAPGFQLFVDWMIWPVFSLGLEGGYSRMDTEATYAQGVQTGELDYYQAGVNAKLYYPGQTFRPYLTVSLDRTWNKGDFVLDPPVGDVLSEHRVHKTRRDGVGAGFDWNPTPPTSWGLRLEGRYNTTFDDQDADEHIRWKAAFVWFIGGLNRINTSERGGLYE